MNTNTALVPAGAATLPPAKLIKSTDGKIRGTIQHFTGSMSAKEIKESLKASGLKGKELTKAVNQTLRGEKDLRQQMGLAYMQALYQDGFMPDLGKLNKKGDKAQITMVKPMARVSAKDVQDAIATGAMTKEERDALLAILMGVEETEEKK